MKDFNPFMDQIEKILKKKHRYPLEAYRFVLDALNYTVARLEKKRHVTGRELLDGIRDFAFEQFGPMARTVLNYWGIHRTDDFGQIVFDLVDVSLLRKQPQDKLEDFKDVYDFDEAFDKGYRIQEED